MATFGALKSEVADDLARSDLTAQISQAILDAVEYHSTERFWFNETRGATIPTIDATSDYVVTSSITGTGIADFITIDYVQFAQSSTNKWFLDPIDPDEMEEFLVGASEGQPVYYTYYNLTFQLYPIPDGIYTVRVAGHYRMTALSADVDTNAWTTDARNLIRATARKLLYGRVIRSPEEAMLAQQDEGLELARLRTETSRRRPPGVVRPWE